MQSSASFQCKQPSSKLTCKDLRWKGQHQQQQHQQPSCHVVQVSSSFSMDGVLLWTPGPSWRKGNFYKQWTTRRSWNCRWSAEGSDCTSFILLLPFDLIGCHFCPWNLKRLRLIISCNTCLLGPFLFFLRIFWGQKNVVERQKWLISSHAKVDVRTKDAFSKNHLFGAWSLLFGPKFDVKKDPRWGTKRSTVVEYLLSTIRSGVSPDELSCYCVILWYRKTSANCWVSNLWSTDSRPSGVSAAFWRISLQNTAQICMICSNVGSRHPKNVAPMKDIDRFSCRTLRWNIVTHVCIIYIYIYICIISIYICIYIYEYDIYIIYYTYNTTILFMIYVMVVPSVSSLSSPGIPWWPASQRVGKPLMLWSPFVIYVVWWWSRKILWKMRMWRSCCFC